MSVTVAALFVAKGGCYFGLPDVDPYDEARDARKYAGPHPVVCHSPCERWGRYWSGGPNPRAERRLKGDDGGCFAFALASVRRWGGVLEHPEASHAFAAHGLARPPRKGGWIGVLDGHGGFVCCVEQGNYGHRARKATWLYCGGGAIPPDMRWGSSGPRERLDRGFHSAAERRAAKERGDAVPPRTSSRENLATPPAFRDLLLSIARSAR